MSAPGEGTQARATMTASDRLEWQSELDSAMADIDSKLQHPRRRATDAGPQPQLPELGQIDLTSELLDEIAWRVCQAMRRTQTAANDLVIQPADLQSAPA